VSFRVASIKSVTSQQCLRGFDPCPLCGVTTELFTKYGWDVEKLIIALLSFISCAVLIKHIYHALVSE
jgi:hypothetical protein